ncbi:MAG: transposase [Thaumarchaeota archaeon]|nr:transposase [Nitrososphaerota archaeon]
MTDRKSRSTDEKVRVVLQTLNPQASMAEICREHNLVPRTVYGWKEKFLTDGRSSLDGPDVRKQVTRHKKEISSLRRIIGECAVANDTLKKRWGTSYSDAPK